MTKKTIIILTLLAVSVLQSFGQITETQSNQEVTFQIDQKYSADSYTRQYFVVGGAALGQPSTFRLQMGFVKKWGFYLAGSTNFRFEQPDGDYGEHPQDYLWTGKHSYTRWGVHLGPVVRFSPTFMMYFGTGFGRCLLLHETVSGHKIYSHHYPLFDRTILNLDLGFNYQIKHFAISWGGSFATGGNISFPTANIGLGLMF